MAGLRNYRNSLGLLVFLWLERDIESRCFWDIYIIQIRLRRFSFTSRVFLVCARHWNKVVYGWRWSRERWERTWRFTSTEDVVSLLHSIYVFFLKKSKISIKTSRHTHTHPSLFPKHRWYHIQLNIRLSYGRIGATDSWHHFLPPSPAFLTPARCWICWCWWLWNLFLQTYGRVQQP